MALDRLHRLYLWDRDLERKSGRWREYSQAELALEWRRKKEAASGYGWKAHSFMRRKSPRLFGEGY